MDRSDSKYEAYVRILKNHLRPAMGCTEPIAIAYASALARRTLGAMPERAQVLVSGSIIKNAKSVVVPNTGGKKGIEAACAAGLIAGDPDKELQVICEVSDEQQAAIDKLIGQGIITAGIKEDARSFDILVTLEGHGHTASARIADRHTNVVTLMRDGYLVVGGTLDAEDQSIAADEALLTIDDIYAFASECDIADVEDILSRQLAYNYRIAKEGISGRWGAGVGKTLLDCYGSDDIRILAKAYAAAGSDARMSGCELPVIINSGSGNQGITVSVPVIVYAERLHVTKEQLYRALTLSNLIAIRVKTLIGCLSAYCGAISAGCASGAGIAYLNGGDIELVNHTLVNGLAILSGTICDGAKPSCAAKIASAIDAALTGYQMALAGKEFLGGDGIVKKGVENTIQCVGRLGKDGMRETDREILRIMMG